MSKGVKLFALIGLSIPAFMLLMGFGGFHTLWLLLFGWFLFVQENSAYIQFNQGIFLSFIGSLLFFCLSGHLFLKWLYQNYGEPDEKKQWKLFWTFSFTGIFILMFVTSIAITGLIHQITWLMTTDHPIVEPFSMFPISTKIGPALEDYKAKNSQYPISIEPVYLYQVESLKTYYEKLSPIRQRHWLNDIWNTPIQYQSDGKSYILRSFGPNKLLGGGKSEYDDIVMMTAK